MSNIYDGKFVKTDNQTLKVQIFIFQIWCSYFIDILQEPKYDSAELLNPFMSKVPII